MSAGAAVWPRLPVGTRLAAITACSINVALVKDNAVASRAPSTIWPRPDFAFSISAASVPLFHADNFGAEFGQQGRAVRPRDIAPEIQDAHALQNSPHRPTFAFVWLKRSLIAGSESTVLTSPFGRLDRVPDAGRRCGHVEMRHTQRRQCVHHGVHDGGGGGEGPRLRASPAAQPVGAPAQS